MIQHMFPVDMVHAHIGALGMILKAWIHGQMRLVGKQSVHSWKGLQERPGGLCTSAWWDLISSGQSQCTYYQDTPQFHKRLVTSTAHGGILEESYLKAFVMPWRK